MGVDILDTYSLETLVAQVDISLVVKSSSRVLCTHMVATCD